MTDQIKTSPPVTLDREQVDGACPQCSAKELAAYPVYSEGGWFNVVKCQSCLHSVSRTPWGLHGPLTFLVDQI